jgi:hypothetical protein
MRIDSIVARYNARRSTPTPATRANDARDGDARARAERAGARSARRVRATRDGEDDAASATVRGDVGARARRPRGARGR